MQDIFLSVAVIIVIASFVSLYRGIEGPGIFNRIIAVNVIGTKTIVLLVLIGFIYERPDFFDIALVYAILNFIMTIAATRY
ncbi:MAG: cation:proton antiporter [Methanosarcinales archaeon]|nr:cation:proton antiporter [Methanosarcinales archaeon]MCD4799400.1 cation:proton antiporter [Methanosarcinales archaeon]MCD4810923.1 cation:proton antiporter [Methanosarcinales archaeon]MCD4815249.1 cation:proton antiporter [Methanosarcinales archaeon]